MAPLRAADRDSPAPSLRSIRADNPSALTLDGTRTYLVGSRHLAVIDPGPALPDHLEELVFTIGGADAVAVLVTHSHPDHAAGAETLAARVAGSVRSVATGSLADGEAIETDAGSVIALATPGHTADHVAFHWPAEGAVFCGDLMLGGQDTALVAPPEGNLALYLESLRRLSGLRPRVIYPAHGPPFEDPPAAIERYVRHRQRREAQVLSALEAGVAEEEELVHRVYGAEVPEALLPAARAALPAYLEHLLAEGRVRRGAGGRWIAIAEPDGSS